MDTMRSGVSSLRIAALLAVISLATVAAAPAGQMGAKAAPIEAVTINAQGPAEPFPHYWERMFGSGRAVLALRADYRKDMRAVKRATDFDYLRFHGIFDRGVGLYHVGADGKPDYNFSYVDQIYDGLLANGIRPYVELSFMPRALASSPVQQGFWYHPYVAPPKNWNQWGSLIRHFAQHLVARYGIDEVSHWYFEVWNEPNIGFWAGKPKQATYFKLYDTAARALKSVNPRLRVGGPATAQAAWVSAFIRHCVENNVPVDFVSTHVYGNDSAQNVFGTSRPISRQEMVIRAVEKVHREVAESERPGLPIIFSEYNASYKNESDVTDSAFMGPWLAHTIKQCAGMVKILAYWDFSDVFEEQGVVKRPFYGGFGLMAEDDIPKASYNVFALLHRLGTERLAASSGPDGGDAKSVLATKRAGGTLAIALWNYAPPAKTGPGKTFNLSIENPGALRHAVIWRVDRHHGSALTAWKAMGEPDFPTRGQIELLREAGRLPAPEIRDLPSGNTAPLSLTLPSHGFALVEIEP